MFFATFNGILKRKEYTITINENEGAVEPTSLTKYYTNPSTLVSKPADWDTNYNTYFTQEDNTYVINTNSTWQEGVYYSLTAVATKPADWDTNYATYLIRKKNPTLKMQKKKWKTIQKTLPHY